MKAELIIVIGAGDPRRDVVMRMIGELSRVVAMSHDESEALHMYAEQVAGHPGKIRAEELEAVLSRQALFNPGEKFIAAQKRHVYSSTRSRAGRAARWS